MSSAIQPQKKTQSTIILSAVLFAAILSARAADEPNVPVASRPANAAVNAPVNVPINAPINGTTNVMAPAKTSPVTPDTAPSASVLPRAAMVGTIEIPAVGISTKVIEGADAGILKISVGHIPGTAAFGPSGNVGLAAHNNMFFRPLEKIKVGDEIRYSTTGGTFKYRVVSLRVVLPTAVEVLKPTEKPTITLVTCYPFHSKGNAPTRLIVRGEMIEDPSETTVSSNLPQKDSSSLRSSE